MRKLVLTLAMLAALVAAPAVANAQTSFLFGMLVGGTLFGNNNQYAGGGATILYSADEEKLKATNPLDVRLMATRSCFHSGFNWDKTNKSLGELFEELTTDLPKREKKKERVILQIARVFSAVDPQCAAIWFAYVEK